MVDDIMHEPGLGFIDENCKISAFSMATLILHTFLYFIKSGGKHSGVVSYNFLCIPEFRVETDLQLQSNSISLNWYLRQNSRVNSLIHIHLKNISPKLKSSRKAGICTRHKKETFLRNMCVLCAVKYLNGADV